MDIYVVCMNIIYKWVDEIYKITKELTFHNVDSCTQNK
jgi:hypothetical protein